MVRDAAVIPLNEASRARWQNWMNCLAAMVEDLKALTVPAVDEILAKYSCEHVDVGMGMNLDWPEGDPRAVVGLEPVSSAGSVDGVQLGDQGTVSGSV